MLPFGAGLAIRSRDIPPISPRCAGDITLRLMAQGRSNTWRRSIPTCGASARLAPHPAHGPGSCRLRSPASSTSANVDPGCPGCPPGLRPLRRRSDFGAGLVTASPTPGASTSSGCSGPTAAATRQPQPRTARSARPAAPREQRAPHRTDDDRQTPRHDRHYDLEINSPRRRRPDQLLVVYTGEPDSRTARPCLCWPAGASPSQWTCESLRSKWSGVRTVVTSRICVDLDIEVGAFRDRSLADQPFPCSTLCSTPTSQESSGQACAMVMRSSSPVRSLGLRV